MMSSKLNKESSELYSFIHPRCAYTYDFPHVSVVKARRQTCLQNYPQDRFGHFGNRSVQTRIPIIFAIVLESPIPIMFRVGFELYTLQS